MSGKAIGGIISSLLGLVVACAAGVVLLFGGGAGGCATGLPAGSPAASAPPGGWRPIGDWNSEQVDNARTIITVGARMNVPPRGWVIAVAAAMQESKLQNLAHGDRDSVGLFQQRPSQGWGTRDQLTDPEYAAGKFYDKLLTVEGWQNMPLTDAAQAVQISAYPDAYAKWEPEATRLVTTLTGQLPTCDATVSPQGWVVPVKGPIGDDGHFRRPARPKHHGVDILAPAGTLIHAAAAGTVLVATCQISAGTCDQEGSRRLEGCGWYVDLQHAQRVITRYCWLCQPELAPV